MGLPAGVVTFLFTDIQGSTRLFQEHAAEYPKLLDAHNRIIRDAVAAHDGYEVSTEGDAFFVAFSSPIEGVRAAVDAQLELGRYPWPDGAAIRVRMGLHTDEATPRAETYVALAVHQAARVADAGHGGQVLLSDATARLCDAAIAPFHLIALGPHILRDFPRVEPLHQVAGGGLARDFPALRTPTATTNVPRPRTSFIGRDEEMAAIEAMITNSSLITLTGTGGTGKTRMAAELARRIAHHFDNGVVWVDLAARTDADLVPQAVAEALGIGEQSGRVLVHTIVDHLATTRTLIVIDNCEHLLEASAHMVEEILDGCQHIVVVATSREPLGVSDETVYRVPSLATGDDTTTAPAIELFVDRARKVAPKVELDEVSLAAIRTICTRLDGIPLAIELAASRLRGMSVTDLATRIEDRFALLSGGARTALPRQQTLRGLVDWSYELLDDNEKEVFRRVSVFNGRFPIDGVEAVCLGLAVEVLDVMARLVDKSLVDLTDVDHAARYQLLQTIRHYGFERLLDSGEAANVRSLHRDWCAGVVAELPGTTNSDAHQRSRRILDELMEDVRASFDWCASSKQPAVATSMFTTISWYFSDCGLFTEARKRGDALLEQLTRGTSEFVDVLETLKDLTWQQGDYRSSAGYSRLLVELDAEPASAARWNAYGASLWRLGRLEEAERAFRRALELEDDDGARAAFFHNIALTRIDAGDPAGARAALEQARAAPGDDIDVLRPIWTRFGLVARLEGDDDEAMRCFDVAAATAEESWTSRWLDHFRGEVALARGELDAADGYFASTLNHYTMQGNTNGVAWEQLHMGRVALARGDIERARANVEEASAVFERQGDLSKIADSLGDRARITAAEGNRREAAQRWRDCVEAWRASAEELRLGEALLDAAAACLAADEPIPAYEALSEGVEFWCQRGNYPISRIRGRAAYDSLDALRAYDAFDVLANALRKRLVEELDLEAV